MTPTLTPTPMGGSPVGSGRCWGHFIPEKQSVLPAAPDSPLLPTDYASLYLELAEDLVVLRLLKLLFLD